MFSKVCVWGGGSHNKLELSVFKRSIGGGGGGGGVHNDMGGFCEKEGA